MISDYLPHSSAITLIDEILEFIPCESIRVRSVIKTSVITKRNVMMVHRINRCINLQSQISHVSLLIESHVIKQRITSQEKGIMVDKKCRVESAFLFIDLNVQYNFRLV